MKTISEPTRATTSTEGPRPVLGRRPTMPKFVENMPRAGAPLAVALRNALQGRNST